jgi:hypothetical protein
LIADVAEEVDEANWAVFQEAYDGEPPFIRLLFTLHASERQQIVALKFATGLKRGIHDLFDGRSPDRAWLIPE